VRRRAGQRVEEVKEKREEATNHHLALVDRVLEGTER